MDLGRQRGVQRRQRQDGIYRGAGQKNGGHDRQIAPVPAPDQPNREHRWKPDDAATKTERRHDQPHQYRGKIAVCTRFGRRGNADRHHDGEHGQVHVHLVRPDQIDVAPQPNGRRQDECGDGARPKHARWIEAQNCARGCKADGDGQRQDATRQENALRPEHTEIHPI